MFICLALFCVGGHFALFPNVLKQVFGKQATVLYGVMSTGTGIASVFIIGLIFSPVGDSYQIMFYIFGTQSIFALIILILLYEQKRFEPEWATVFLEDPESTIGNPEGKTS